MNLPEKNGGNRRVVFTIGHSTHPIERVLELLRMHDVTAVADVRSSPYSRFNPQFNREAFRERLGKEGIKYVYLGRELGGRSKDKNDYRNGRVLYGRLREKPGFDDGIARVLRGASQWRIALVCAEKEPLDCHRTLLVAPVLTERGALVKHILADGQLEPHAKAMARLIEKRALDQPSLPGMEGD